MSDTRAAEDGGAASAPRHSEVGGLAELAVLIPAWQPEPGLIELTSALLDRGFGLIAVVDDGSREACSPIFAAVAEFNRVEVLHHAVNLGKGRALKSGLNHLLAAHGNLAGVVTADADGQHTAEDIARVGQALLFSGKRAVLGVRSFAADVPTRSRVGNLLTRQVFSLVTGTRITDTQTGLRGLPRAVWPFLLTLEGERYEYEMTMLVHLCRTGPRPIEVPISTVYLESNRGSHFNPVWDSMRIYFVLLRFMLRL